MVTLHAASLDSCIYSKAIEFVTHSSDWPVDFLLRLVKIFGH